MLEQGYSDLNDTSSCDYAGVVPLRPRHTQLRLLRITLALSLSMCVIPSFANFGGTVVDLSGAPVAGAVVKVAGDSACTITNGTWLISRASGIHTIHSEAISVASHLEVERGRIRIRFGGFDVTGRGSAAKSTVTIPTAARSMGTSDTVAVYWKGKRLVLLTVPPESLSILTRIDTAWSDDHSTPWNASVTYGSITDSRDGQVYRTVKIDSQTWMAENLNYRNVKGSIDTVGVCYGNSADICSKHGRLYTWAEVMNWTRPSNSRPSGVTGICPTGWHVPSDSEWTTAVNAVEAKAGAGKGGTALKSISGWSTNPGKDDYGFRVLPAGGVDDTGSFNNASYIAYFWSSSEDGQSVEALSRQFYNSYNYVYRGDSWMLFGHSLRCVEGGAREGTGAMAIASPSISPAGGDYTSPQTVAISSAISGASIYYTTDGSTPTIASMRYTGAITVSGGQTIKAVALMNGITSAVTRATYTISVMDSRDEKSYRTVTIGTQTWMAENLNYRNTKGNSDTVGVCYNNSTDSCAKYGRLYTWSEVMAGSASNSANPSGVTGICPTDWHVPSDAEWSTLIGYLNGFGYDVGTLLKSTNGWDTYYDGNINGNGIFLSGNGTDDFSFQVLPAGRIYRGLFEEISHAAYFWTSYESSASNAWYRCFLYVNGDIARNNPLKTQKLSLRCLQNN